MGFREGGYKSQIEMGSRESMKQNDDYKYGSFF